MARKDSRTRQQGRNSTLQLEELEPRMLLSADALGAFAPDIYAAHQLVTDIQLDDKLEPVKQIPAIDDSEDERLELVFVDTDTPDYQQLIDGLLTERNDGRRIDVIVLDNSRDGISQISETLETHQAVDAIHLISHGADGSLDLGGTRLSNDSLVDYQQALQSWRTYLDADADILIYGCNLAATTQGQSLVDRLAILTGADTASSDDLTGHTMLGGDYELEYRTGQVESGTVFGTELQGAWQAVLADGNNAPALVNNTGLTATEGSTTVITNTMLRYDDALQPATSVTYSISTRPANGQLELTTNAGVEITSFTQSQVDASQVVYVHDGGEMSADSFGFSVNDGQGNYASGSSLLGLTELSNVTAGATDATHGDWSPDGTRLLFFRDNDTYVINADGSNEIQLTNAAGSNFQAVWSPDGSKIAFTSNRDGNDEIYVMDADGSNQVRITNVAGNDGAPSWSPDGSQIAFKSNRDGDNEIFVMDADGSNQIQLTANTAVDGGPNWSPDGTKIAFHSTLDGNYELYVMNSDGSNQTRLTNDPGLDALADWSPDGSRMLFYTDRDGNNEIYMMNADGSNQVRLTNNAADDQEAMWSPSGSRIAFATDIDGNFDLFSASVACENTFAITVTPANDAPVLHDWYNSDWDYRKAVTVQATQVQDSLKDFPVLVTLATDPQLVASALANGDDILFTAADGVTKLAHEIQSYNAGTGALTVWVKTDLSSTADTQLFMYFGNSSASNQQDPTNVWDANYVAVWHLEDNPTGAAGDIKDSTANSNDGQSNGGMNGASLIDARVGKGLDFDEIDDYIRIPDSNSLDSVASEATFELWAWFDNAADTQTQLIMSSSNRYTSGVLDGYEWASQGDGDHFFYPDAMPTDGNFNLGPNPFIDQNWHHIAATMDFDNREVSIYVDGAPMAFGYEGVPDSWVSTASSDDLLWGGNPDRLSRFFDGMMDEIRISSVARSQEWIQTSINNQSNPATFITVGSQEDRDTLLSPVAENTAFPLGDTVLAMLASAGGDLTSDADASALEGIAVTSVDDTNGQWQYDANANGTWLAFGSVTESNAVLLSDSAKIRFVPTADYSGTSGDITFRAWDQTSGSNGQTTVNVTANGGGTAFSSGTHSASLAVTSATNVDPEITSNGGGANAGINIAENETAVTRVTATDADSGDTPLFSISGGADQLLFSIDASVGLLTFTVPPDYENPADSGANNSYEVEVAASDGNGGIDTQLITITVSNEDPIANGAWFDETDDGGGFTDFAMLASAHGAYLGATEQTIDLESLSAGDVLSNQFSVSHGVSFSNTGVAQSQIYLEGGGWIENVTGYDGSYAADGSNVYLKMANDDPATPFTIEFATPVAKVGALLGMGKEGTNHDVLVRLYDSGDGLIDQRTLLAELWDPSSADQNYETFLGIKYDAAIISKIEILNVSNMDYANALIFDQLSWSITPDAADSYTASTAVALVTGSVLANDIDPAGGTLSVSGFTQPANGSASYNGDGTFTYTSDVSFTGSDSFTYTISDGSGGSDTATVNIRVGNTPPTIDSDGGAATAALNVAENATAVTTVTATDVDGDTPIYSIDPASDDDGFFTIDSGTGVLSFTAATDFETPADLNGDNIYEVTVQAGDGNGGADNQAISVTVLNVNEAPIDLQTTATTQGGISLNEDGGNDVYFVADDGGGLLGGLTALTLEAQFSVTTPSVDNTTLLSYADGGNDEELAVMLKSDGTIWFLAHSNGAVRQSSLNQYPELLDGKIHHLAVSWDSSNGAVVMYVDGQPVESFTGYQTGQIISGSGELIFGQDQDSVLGGFNSIDIFSGSLYDVRIFNTVRTAGEIAAAYDLTLPNTEPGMIANWTFQDLSTNGVITDAVSANNLTLQHVAAGGFTASVPELTLRVAENASNGTVIGSLSAVDPDSGETFTYELTDNAGGRFAINNANGQLTLANASLLNFETNSTHDITVRVTDSASQTYDEAITVLVIDVNSAATANDDPLSYNAYLTSLSPAGHWRLGELGGVVAVDSSGSNNGTYYGVTLGQSGAINADGDTALQFDGVDDYVELTHDPAYLFDEGTLQLWFKTSDVNQSGHLFSKDALGEGTGGHLSTYLDGAGHVEVRLQSASASYHVTSSSALANDQWHHLAFTFGTDGMQLYIDGQLQDSDVYAGGMGGTSGDVGNSEPIVIGASTQVSAAGVVAPLEDYFTGNIDEVALIGSALSAQQIQNLFASGVQDYSVSEDNALVVGVAEGVLANDHDPDGDTLTAVLASGPSFAAAFALNSDGSFSYTPNENFSGTDSFTYRANDGTADSALATVTITVNPVNDDPTLDNAIPDQVATEDSPFSFTFAANTFGDADGDPLSYSAQLSGGGALPSWLLFNSGTRMFSGTPANGDVGTVAIQIIADDGNGGTAAVDTFNIAVANSNDAPTGSVLIDNMSPEQGTVLNASHTLADADGLTGPISYQWYRGVTAISGGDTASYTTVDADVGEIITVVASYTDDRGTDETVSSAATNPVAGLVVAPPVEPSAEPPVEQAVEQPSEPPDHNTQTPEPVVQLPEESSIPDSGESPAPENTGLPNRAADPFAPGNTVAGPLPGSNTPGNGDGSESSATPDNPIPGSASDTDTERASGTQSLSKTIAGSEDNTADTRRPGGTRPIDYPAEPAAADVAQLLEQVVENPDVVTAADEPAAGVDPGEGSDALIITERELDKLIFTGGQGVEIKHVNTVLNNHALWQDIDTMKMQMSGGPEAAQEEFVVEVVSTSGAGLVAGLVAYALRGGALMSSMLTTMPLWRAYDPLPVLALADDKKNENKKEQSREEVDADAADERDDVALLFD